MIPSSELGLRLATLYAPLFLLLLLIPVLTAKARSALFFSFWWNFWTLPLLHWLGTSMGFWNWTTTHYLALGMPADIWLGWAILWGCFAALFQLAPILSIAVVYALDLLLMPLLSSLITLNSGWWIMDLTFVLGCYLPGVMIFRWAVSGRCLGYLNALLTGSFIGTTLIVIPCAVLELSGRSNAGPIVSSDILVQLVLLCLLPFLAAIQAFTRYGRGTPVPLLPATRFISRGVFSYVRNPMQLGSTLGLFLLGCLVDPILLVAAATCIIYAEGFARWTEDAFQEKHFPREWAAYKKAVPRWIPRLTPYIPPRSAPAIVYFSRTCGTCSRLQKWVSQNKPVNLLFRDAEDFPRGMPTRLTYVDPEFGVVLSGVRAFAATLNHLSLPYAICGWLLDLPGINVAAQLAMDLLVTGPDRAACALPDQTVKTTPGPECCPTLTNTPAPR